MHLAIFVNCNDKIEAVKLYFKVTIIMSIRKVFKKALGETFVEKLRILRDNVSPTQRQILQKRRLFYNQFVNRNDLCFDVGANIGNRVTPLLQIGARVIAIEPQESCYKILKSRFGKKIEIITKGLGENEGFQKFHISNTSTISSFSEEWINSVKDARFKEHNWDKTIEVDMTTLDELIAIYGIPAFIKIDVEGYELEVLKGLSQPIKMISFEYTVPEQTNKIVECINIVQRNSPNILCNYSTGETMKMISDEWLNVEKFFEHIQQPSFIMSGFGDIYLKEKA